MGRKSWMLTIFAKHTKHMQNKKDETKISLNIYIQTLRINRWKDSVNMLRIFFDCVFFCMFFFVRSYLSDYKMGLKNSSVSKFRREIRLKFQVFGLIKIKLEWFFAHKHTQTHAHTLENDAHNAPVHRICVANNHIYGWVRQSNLYLTLPI